jgi:benzoylsuccinyl-CoA thiolase BbsB subunit
MTHAFRDVAVIGSGMIRFGKYPQRTLDDLGGEAVRDALRDSNVPKSRIECAYVGTAVGGMLAGQRILRDLGLTGIPIVNVDNACSSGATALREAWIAVGAGMYDCALVVGVEQLSRFGGGTIPLVDDDFEVAQGMVMPGLYAMRAQRYMHDCGVTLDDIAGVAVKNRRIGALNPRAQFQKPVTLEQVRAARPIADPFTLLHCCPTGDGAAALVVTSAAFARQFTTPKVHVKTVHLTSGVLMNARDLTVPEITVRSARETYAEAGLGPDDLDLLEVHDAFTIAEILYYEALGLAPHGDGVRLLREGATDLGGRIPVNPSGGLLSRGHPLGASGVAQVVECYDQLLGRAGDRQIAGAKVAMAHVTGGGIAGLDHGACSLTVLTA